MEYDYGQEVLVRSEAPDHFQPGAIGSVCGVYQAEAGKHGVTSNLESLIDIYIVEYPDGSSASIPEMYLANLPEQK